MNQFLFARRRVYDHDLHWKFRVKTQKAVFALQERTLKACLCVYRHFFSRHADVFSWSVFMCVCVCVYVCECLCVCVYCYTCIQYNIYIYITGPSKNGAGCLRTDSLLGEWSCHIDRACEGRNGASKRVSDWELWTAYSTGPSNKGAGCLRTVGVK